MGWMTPVPVGNGGDGVGRVGVPSAGHGTVLFCCVAVISPDP